jgi:hypothetical protein
VRTIGVRFSLVSLCIASAACSATPSSRPSIRRWHAALKDLRNRSRLNRQAPIISAGLSQVHSTPFEVTLRDAIEFLNQNGITKLIDGYGIHVYPSGDPNRPVSARIASLDEDMFFACSPAKPCWVTEWGLIYNDADGQFRPGKNRVVTKVVQDMRTSFRHFSNRGQLAALMYYDWTPRPGSKDTFSVFRVLSCRVKSASHWA